MKVWIVVGYEQYENWVIYGAYSSKEKAVACIEYWKGKGKFHDCWDTEEYNVDEILAE